MNNKVIKRVGILLIAALLPYQAVFCDDYLSGRDEMAIDEPLSLDAIDQTQPEEQPSVSQDDDESGLNAPYNSFSEESGWVKPIWGQPFRNHIYGGMWTLHFSSGEDQEDTNNLLGIAYKGYYAGTFVNTHRDQVVSAGWQRALYRDKWGIFDVEAGYRTGIMYGYTKYLKLGDSKFFPLFQALLDIDYKGFGMEFSWAGVVATAGFYYRF